MMGVIRIIFECEWTILKVKRVILYQQRQRVLHLKKADNTKIGTFDLGIASDTMTFKYKIILQY